MTGVGRAVADVRSRIEAACVRCGRDPAGITIVAATKTVAPESVSEVIAAGVIDIGENRVQEASAKRSLVDGGRWHMIGHLQTNKVRDAVALFDVVQSVDSVHLATTLARAVAGNPLPVLIEVDYTGAPGRAGVPPGEAAALAQHVAALPQLSLEGLMTVAPVGDETVARTAFAALRLLRDRIRDQTGLALPELSMGMSADFEPAVEEGATMVRLGRALFGDRPPLRPGG